MLAAARDGGGVAATLPPYGQKGTDGARAEPNDKPNDADLQVASGPSRHTPDAPTGPHQRPVWLLDVDGVINGTGRAGWQQAPRAGTAFASGIGYRMRWAPQLIAGIRALLPHVDVSWATTWID
jgi:hypothetical protein